MEIICFQPLIDVEGLVKEDDRKAAVERVKAYFPFMRALRTTVVYATTNRSYDFDSHTSDVQVIADDLALFADLAAEYSKADGGPMLKLGYEHLSWCVLFSYSTSGRASASPALSTPSFTSSPFFVLPFRSFLIVLLYSSQGLPH